MNGSEIVGFFLASVVSLFVIARLWHCHRQWRTHLVCVAVVGFVVGIICIMWMTRTRRAFHRTVNAGDILSVQSMIRVNRGVVNTHGWWNRTPLLIAVSRGDVSMVQLLLRNRADPDGSAMSVSPLALAAAEGRTDFVQVLLEAGANRNQRAYRHGKTPLHLAAEYGHAEVVELLIAAGADVNLRSEVGERSPLDDAATDTIRATLLKHGAQ